MRLACEKKEYILQLLFILILTTFSKSGAENERPIIGLLTQSSPEMARKLGDVYLQSHYVKYVESAGARPVAILTNQSSDYYEKLFSSLNGLLLPGGGINTYDSPFEAVALTFFNLAKKAYESGDYFPIWGTCQGFEEMTFLPFQERVLTNISVWNKSLYLNFSDDFLSSRMFHDAPSDVIKILKTQSVTSNFHRLGFSVESYKNHDDLKKFYRVISTNVDDSGVSFISTMEAFDYPFYATQWHPEKNMFEWNPTYDLDHSSSGIKIAQYTADFFVNECRKSSHKFDSPQEEQNNLIYNFNPEYVPEGTWMEQVYFFNVTTH